MPTGYTADISKGITFNTFAMNCARAFGALVTMRDDPSDAPIPEAFSPSDYHSKAIATEREKLARLDTLSPLEAERGAAKEFDDAETARAVRLADRAALRAKYEAMLAAARAWVPPTPEHQGLHDFMVEQIESSIKWDCSTGSYDEPAVRKTASEWLAAQRAETLRSIAYHENEHAEEVGASQLAHRVGQGAAAEPGMSTATSLPDVPYRVRRQFLTGKLILQHEYAYAPGGWVDVKKLDGEFAVVDPAELKELRERAARVSP